MRQNATQDSSRQMMSEPTNRSKGNGFEIALFAALAYLPQLLVLRGQVTPDTKTYLYLNPAKFLKQVVSMWDPTVALGTVTHQYVGYLFPMGPFFLLLHWIGVPVWIAQRLWFGSILFAAALGVRYLSRTLGLDSPGRVIAALAYMMTPFVLQYSGRISVLLLPYAALPWMIGLIAKAVKSDGWRYPALFALVVLTVSSVNASTIFFAGLGPVLWIVFAVVTKETTIRRALRATLKTGLLTAGVCLWWVIGLLIESGYGVDVLKYTETVLTTSSGSTAAEVIRGLGYWYFYGYDNLGAWTRSALLYTGNSYVLALSFFVPVAAFIGAALSRWRYRAFFVLLLLTGLIFSVGPHPLSAPTPFGKLLGNFLTTSTIGLAFRSTDRATPLAALGLAFLLGAGVSALWAKRARFGGWTAALVALLIVVANPALFNGDTIANNFTQPATLPAAQMHAISYLNHTGGSSRVFGLPGNDFASYLWGNTVDTPQPAYLNRPYVTHEQQVMGSLATAETLYAIDDPIQERIANPLALAPMSRLLSAGNVLVQYDTNSKHYGTIPATQLSKLFSPIPQGLSNEHKFGTSNSLNASGTGTLPEVAVYTVTNPRPITRAESDTGAMLVAGDSFGLNDLAGVGLLNSKSAIYFSGSLAADPQRTRSLAKQGALLVVTDSNRKQGFRWTAISSLAGQIETPSQNPAASDTSDSPIELFPSAGLSSKTLASYLGIQSATASSYGSPVGYTPEDRPFNALDGNLVTAWRTGITYSPIGQWWQVSYNSPSTIDHLSLVQPQNGNRSASITSVNLVFDNGTTYPVSLTAASLQPGGQLISFPAQTFKTLRIVITQTTPGPWTGVGLAEVNVPDHTATEVIQMPSDLLSTLGSSSLNNRLTLEMSRWRTSLPGRSDAQTTIVRSFTLPTARSFELTGNVTLDSTATVASVQRALQSLSPPGASTQEACVDGLLSIDGKDIPLTITGTSSKALMGSSLQLTPCGSGTSGIELSAGTHLLTTALAATASSAWEVNQLVLDSQAGGLPGGPASNDGTLSAVQPGSMPNLVTHTATATSESGVITNVTSPFELVLGESINAGWRGTLSANGHSVSLQGSELVDAFANGWHITQADLQLLGLKTGESDSVHFSLTWTPQKTMNYGFLLSLLAIALCLYFAIRRRRSGDGADALQAPVIFSWPWSQSSPLLLQWQRAVAALSIGIGAWFLGGTKIGFAVVVLAVLALWVPRLRWLLPVGALGFLTLAVLHIVEREARFHYDFIGWTGNFNNDSRLVLLAVLLLSADAVISMLRRRKSAPNDDQAPSEAAKA